MATITSWPDPSPSPTPIPTVNQMKRSILALRDDIITNNSGVGAMDEPLTVGNMMSILTALAAICQGDGE